MPATGGGSGTIPTLWHPRAMRQYAEECSRDGRSGQPRDEACSRVAQIIALSLDGRDRGVRSGAPRAAAWTRLSTERRQHGGGGMVSRLTVGLAATAASLVIGVAAASASTYSTT